MLWHSPFNNHYKPVLLTQARVDVLYVYEFYVHPVIGVETELIFVISFLVSAEKKCSWHSFNAVSHLPVRSASIMLLLFAYMCQLMAVIPPNE